MKAYLIPILTVIAPLVLVHSAFASPPTSAKGYSGDQVDGIASAVVDGLWSRSDYWWHHGDYPRVIGDDRLITEAEPHFVEPYSDGGWLMESQGNNSDAEKYYRLGAIRNPNESYLWFNLGFFYFNTVKNYPLAVKSFQTATAASDAGINDWKMLAHSYEKNKQLVQAIAVWQKLNKTHPMDGPITHNLTKDQRLLAAAADQVAQ